MEYWNHNTAYYPFIVEAARDLDGDVLDVGCGEGLLVELLASVSRSVTGVDSDPYAVMRARARIKGVSNARVDEGNFMEVYLEHGSYDLVTMVATLHHLDFEETISRVRSLLRPGGKLLVIGLSANKSIGDWALSGATLPVVRLLSHVHAEHRDIQVVTTAPIQNLREIRAIAGRLLPGCKIRRGLYYRYILNWTKAL
jgi:SAM-dependent methyltransferase